MGELGRKGGVGEFESARVYLARLARVAAEKGELFFPMMVARP